MNHSNEQTPVLTRAGGNITNTSSIIQGRSGYERS